MDNVRAMAKSVGEKCSLHHHRMKSNIFYVVSGKLKIHIEMGEAPITPQSEILEPGQSFRIDPMIKHQFEAMEETIAVEIMFCSYDAKDIIRETEGFIQDYGKKNEDG